MVELEVGGGVPPAVGWGVGVGEGVGPGVTAIGEGVTAIGEGVTAGAEASVVSRYDWMAETICVSTRGTVVRLSSSLTLEWDQVIVPCPSRRALDDRVRRTDTPATTVVLVDTE
jgi:hypothetical protein